MTEFTARNGVTVRISDAGSIYVDGQYVLVNHEIALREFFQRERDDELGRWRWPENPDYVVYPPEVGFVKVLHEPTAETTVFERAWHRMDSDGDRAARAYFDAHPEPKPWHDAKPGETWVLTVNGVGMSLTADSTGEFQGLITISPKSTSITAGRRIYPKEEQ